MLFSLSSIKKRSVRDADGELAVVPKLLHGRTMARLLTQAIEVFEEYVGKARADYDPRALEAVMGDYRLARCVEACLLTRYSFVQPSLDSLLSQANIKMLPEKGLTGPSEMRFALWDAASERYGGSVPPDERAAFLKSLADEWGLPAGEGLLNALISLDSESSAVLTSTGERPGPRDLMRLYNRGVVQTLLAHSTIVRFDVSHLPGAALRRLYFVAKRRGVLVDIDETDGGYSLALYGPEQAFGTADKYGRRLAEVSLSLLRVLMSSGTGADVTVAGTASLVLHDRPYRFHLTGEILARMEYAPEPVGEVKKGRVAESNASYSVGSAVTVQEAASEEVPSFDSLLESRLYKEYKSLERQGYTHGWMLQREPEPLLAPGVVLIPDFAFLRGETHVFMEIVGFWSPSYRERKLAKLRSLAARDGEGTALILAVPQDAAPLFQGLPFPVVPYKTGVKATDMLTLLDAKYGQREQRREAAGSQVSSLKEAAKERGLVPEQEVAQVLQAYTRSELLSSVSSLDGADCTYVAGVGLLSHAALETVRVSLQRALGSSTGKLDLDAAASIAASALSTQQVNIEGLAQLWPEWRIERPSLFEAYLVGPS